MKLDRLDARILHELQQDGRRPVVELANDISLSATPCTRRIRNMEAAGVIEGYSAIVNPTRVGLRAQAFVQVKLERHADDIVATFERELRNLEEVTHCFATTGSHDFLLQVVAPDLDALSNVVLKKLLKIPGVRDLHSSIVLETIKRSARLPLTHLGL
jgi:Lrp/AsnC family leucine-responsive transcriptional regulator